MLEWMNMLRADWLIATSQFSEALEDMPARVHDYWRLQQVTNSKASPGMPFFTPVHPKA